MDPPIPPDRDRRTWLSILAAIIILAFLACLPVLLPPSSPASPVSPSVLYPGGGAASCNPPFTPVFTDPARKLVETGDPAFTRQLFGEALLYEPLLNTSGTQVHMGFWSGPGNHGRLVALLDAINDQGVSADNVSQRAIWDEGVTTYDKFPSYTTMLEEHWYERTYPRNGTVTIYGRSYTDPFPVTPAQADHVWGQYSQRYADMAFPIAGATGKPVKVWCYVTGAKAGRIFYSYELPELRELERKGVVTVSFARTANASWTQPSDWIVGTDNAPVPVSG